MCKVLLVDDEDLEVQGLSLMLQGFGLPIEICGTARNGQEGLLQARKLRPEIILTDLRMPVLSGIEMVRQIPCEGYTPHSIIISGYEDFEAAREGIELGVSSYLLKPVKREKLFQAVSKLCPQEVSYNQVSPNEVSHLFPPKEEHMLQNALMGPIEKASDILSQLPFSVYLQRKKTAVMSILLSQLDDEILDDLKFVLQRFSKEIEALVPVLMNRRTMVLVVTIPWFMDDGSIVDHLSKTADKLLEKFDQQGINDVYIGISDVCETPEKLPHFYRQSLLALEKRSDSLLSRVFFFEDFNKSDKSQKALPPNATVSYVQKFIDENYSKPLSIEIIVKGLYLSPSYVRRLFKNHMGISVMEYVESVRMNHAALLLCQLQYKVQEIGALVGYENPSYFNLVFRKYFGLTPGEYRRITTEPK